MHNNVNIRTRSSFRLFFVNISWISSFNEIRSKLDEDTSFYDASKLVPNSALPSNSSNSLGADRRFVSSYITAIKDFQTKNNLASRHIVNYCNHKNEEKNFFNIRLARTTMDFIILTFHKRITAMLLLSIGWLEKLVSWSYYSCGAARDVHP